MTSGLYPPYRLCTTGCESSSWWLEPKGDEKRETELHEVRQVRDEYCDRLHSLPGCTGLSIGEDADGGYFITLYFDSRERIDELKRQGRIHDSLEGVFVQFEVAGPFVPQVDAQEYRPVPGGVSGDPEHITEGYGTLGGWVRDHVTGRLCLISREHVFRS